MTVPAVGVSGLICTYNLFITLFLTARDAFERAKTGTGKPLYFTISEAYLGSTPLLRPRPRCYAGETYNLIRVPFVPNNWLAARQITAE
jgi:hypothetical protein